MLSSYIYVNNVDISSVFQPWTSGSTLTRIYIQGAELGTKFQAYSSGANAAATRIYVGPSDLNTIFQKYSSAPSPSLYNINNSNLVRYYPFDTNLSDYVTGSAVANTTSINGAAVVTTNTKLTSGSLYVNGASSQAIQIPSITIAAGGFTFACWIKYISGGLYARIFDFGTGQNTNIVCMYQANTTSILKIGLYLTNTSSGSGGAFDTGFTLPDANWHHVCATVSSAGLWTVYIDGVSNVTSVTAYPSAVNLALCYLGKSINTGAANPTFYMNQVLIFNRALTSAEIGIIYNYPNQLTFTSAATYSPPVITYNINNSNLVRYYPFDTNLSDYVTGSAVANTTSIGGAAISTSNTKLTSGSLFINGSPQGLQIPNLSIAAGGFTFCCWFKFISGNISSRIFDFGIGNANTGAGNNNILLSINRNGQNLPTVNAYIINSTTGPSSGNVLSNYIIPDTNWHHICLTISSAGLWKLYGDGIEYTFTTTINQYPALNTTLTHCYLGKSTWPGDPYPTCYMNQVLIFNRELTSAEIGVIYNYPNNLTFTSAASYQLPDIPVPQFFLEFTSTTVPTQATIGGAIAKTETGGTITIENEVTRGYVLYTPAGNSYITTSYRPTVISTRTFWYKRNGNLGTATNTVSSGNAPLVSNNDTDIRVLYTTNAGVTISEFIATSTSNSKWVHYAVIYDGNISKIYINGVLNSSSSTISFTGESDFLRINSCKGNQYGTSAYFDKIRSYNSALTANQVKKIYNSEYIAEYLKPANLLYAFSVRRIISSYTGPVLRLRRSSDNTESDFYSDSIQSYLTTGAGNTGTTFSSWVGAGTAYVAKWYDQSGKNVNAEQSSTGNTTSNTTTQPYITIQNNKYVIYFDNNSSRRNYLTLISEQSPYTMFSHFKPEAIRVIVTIFCKFFTTDHLADYGQRFVNITANPNPWPISYTNAGDWYYSLTGTKNAYVNGASATTITNIWTSMALSSTGIASNTSRRTLQHIGTDGYASDRGLNGYMTEMLGHNSTYAALSQTIIQSDLTAFYTNRLF